MYSSCLYDLPELLKSNPYPGRGILLGRTPGGAAVAVCFLMGRSVNSRNRVYVRQGDDLLIRLHDPGKLSDPSLILYRPARRLKDLFILTNGDHTDTVYETLMAGGTFEEALRSRSFEPDAPNYTPRISGLMRLGGGGDFTLSVLRAADPEGQGCDRLFFSYAARPGEGRFLHTYLGDADPLPSFFGEPARVGLPSDPEAFSRLLWDSLHPDNRVALCLWAFDPRSLRPLMYLYNRHKETGEGEDAGT